MMFRAAGAKKFFGRKPPTGKVDTAKSSKYVVFFIPYYSQLSLNRHLYSKNWWITPYKNGHQEWHWQNPASVCFVDQLWFVKPVLNSPPLLSSQLAIPKGYCRSTNSLLFTSMTETKELQKKKKHKLNWTRAIRPLIAQSVQFSKIAKKLNIDLCQFFSHRKEALSLLKSWNKKWGSPYSFLR